MSILYSVIVLGSIGLLAAIILVISNNKLKVADDPKVEKIIEALPGLNCGACGEPSCHEYALKISKEESEIDLCRAGGKKLSESIAAIIGLEHVAQKSVLKAVVRCGVKNRKKIAVYRGSANCLSANISGGGLACKYGCFGYGDCESVCPFDAIHLNENLLPVVAFNNCTACGLCVKVCPRDIIILQEVEDITTKNADIKSADIISEDIPQVENRIVYVGCRNRQTAKYTRNICDVGCIACNICVKRAPEGAFEVRDNLSSVKNQKEIDILAIKCPTGCIYENT